MGRGQPFSRSNTIHTQAVKRNSIPNGTFVLTPFLGPKTTLGGGCVRISRAWAMGRYLGGTVRPRNNENFH